MKILSCSICGNQILKLSDDGGGDITCCGKKMEIPEFNQLGDKEYHIPKYQIDGCTLSIDVSKHPNLDSHHIKYILICTSKRIIVNNKSCDMKYKLKLEKDEKLLGIYSYCNIHGWWMADIK